MDLGISQRRLARQLGVCKSSLENWETDKTEPARWLIPRLNQFLGLRPSQSTDSLGERLTAYRRSLGLSQGELARSLGVERCTVVRWETGRTCPCQGHLTTIETILDGPRLPRGGTARVECE